MDDIGYTAVHLCAERGYFDLLRLLLDHGAKVRFTELKPDDRVCMMFFSFLTDFTSCSLMSILRKK